jgi:hypothetical protein
MVESRIPARMRRLAPPRATSERPDELCPRAKRVPTAERRAGRDISLGFQLFGPERCDAL